MAPEDLIDFTPELRAKALSNLKKFRWEQSPFVPYVIPNDKVLGTILIASAGGGVNWQGSSFNPETGIFYTQANNSGVSAASLSEEYFDKIKPEVHTKNGHIPIWEAPGFATPGFEAPSTSGYRPNPVAGGPPPAPAAGAAPVASGRARGANALTEGLGGLSIVKPPYGVVTALDMNTGALKWQVPHGDTPDSVRNNPLLKGLEHPEDRTGRGCGRRPHQVPGHRRRPDGDGAARPGTWGHAARV